MSDFVHRCPYCRYRVFTAYQPPSPGIDVQLAFGSCPKCQQVYLIMVVTVEGIMSFCIKQFDFDLAKRDAQSGAYELRTDLNWFIEKLGLKSKLAISPPEYFAEIFQRYLRESLAADHAFSQRLENISGQEAASFVSLLKQGLGPEDI